MKTLLTLCVGVAIVSTIARVGLAASAIRPTAIDLAATPPPADTPSTRPSVLPKPEFLSFEVVQNIDGIVLDWADNGTILEALATPQASARKYRVTTSDGKQVTYDKLRSDERITMSLGGRILKFSTPPNVQTPRRFSSGYGIGPAMIASRSYASGPFNRRFLDDGRFINYSAEPDGEFSVILGPRPGIQVSGPSQQKQILLKRKATYLVVEHVRPDIFWIIVFPQRKPPSSQELVRVDSKSTRYIPLPTDVALLRFLCETGGRIVLTGKSKDPESFNVIFDLKSTGWVQRPLPQGYAGGSIQKITEDGLEYGHLEAQNGDLIPVVWKEGKPYDLRRLPSWPNDGAFSIISGTNRLGDLCASSFLSTNDEPQTIRLLRRSVTKQAHR